MEQKTRVLVVEDEENMRQLLRLYFERENFIMDEAINGKDALDIFKKNTYDLIVLDVMLPELDGWAVCRKIRQISKIPIIMVTARGEEFDRLFGFELGVDDYIVKPFSPRELIARVKALLRRSIHKPRNEQRETLFLKEITIDLKSREVYLKNKRINLTPKEYDLLLFLIHHRNTVFTREQLLQKVWGYEYFGDLRTVDTHIRRLREKLEEYHHYIATVWGVGYKLEVEDYE
ncbi:response regulator transcription factor [Irregularibacter muris]|uniref:Stage 0 sporulation protein A homolog n=1 Tax=Irregularibacter muris TaxID=1796619 RepID=A0AAE3KZ66_9FIRM|nr:response regulator transcription factor [Irregularibacter muris]MCR1897767.1 response regulator transcription factor [Irregularibacter muris]